MPAAGSSSNHVGGAPHREAKELLQAEGERAAEQAVLFRSGPLQAHG